MGYFTTDDGARLHYKMLGEGGQVILFVHGYFDSGNGFAEISGPLQQGNRVLVYDHRAHGKSDTPEDGYTITRLAADLKNLLDHLGLESVVAVGYSMGVHVLYRFIELYGVQRFAKLVVSVMSPRLLTDESYHLGLEGNTDAKAALDALLLINRSLEDYNLRGMTDDMPEEQKALMRANAKHLAQTHKQGPMLRLLLAMFEHDFWPILPCITCPTLVIAGEHDIYPTETQREVQRRIPGAQLAIVEGCGHMLMYERPGAYIQALASFITGR